LISVTQHLKKKNGDYFQMLQQSIIVEIDKTSKPLLVLSYLSDVSHIKRPDFADMVISYPQYNEIYFYDYENRTLQQKKPLSGKETDVLKLLSQGFDTKMIAHKLHLSPNTVDTHRRNLIKKTNCFDTTAVVTYARLTGLI
ncbi:MAG TPA: LuxR C-terminal-related transcriptional regulator, partial [Chitinophagaceae bacterium]|nr:LuxR C-terminal-related transcriptional regulator [Chitinophagaceae bacterium]